MYFVFFCHCGKNPYLEGVFRCSAQSCDFLQQSVHVGLPRSHKVKYAFEQVWVARTLKNRKYFEKGWEGGLLHPSVCLHPVFVSTPWADYGRQRQGQRQGQSRRGWASSTSPGPAPAPKGAGCPCHPPPGNLCCCCWFGFSWVLLLLFLCCHFCPMLE